MTDSDCICAMKRMKCEDALQLNDISDLSISMSIRSGTFRCVLGGGVFESVEGACFPEMLLTSVRRSRPKMGSIYSHSRLYWHIPS